MHPSLIEVQIEICKNFQGLTAFDFVTDFEEWTNSGFFDEATQARLKGIL
jgi:hypothetical protein